MEMPFGLRTPVGPYYMGRPDRPMGRGNFEGGEASRCRVQRYFAVICAKTAEPIEVPFGLGARMGPRNHVLDGGLDPRRNG